MADATNYRPRKALATNSTNANLQTVATPTATKPTTAGFHALESVSNSTPSHIWVLPYGANAANETFLMRIWGWNYDPTAGLWVPNLLALLTCTLGNIAAASLGTDNFVCDTLVLTSGSSTEVVVTSPANDTPAHATVNMLGATHVEFDFGLNSSSESNNALWRPFSQ